MAGKPIHGMSKTDEHKIWCSMLRRCGHFKKGSHKKYGQRGIKVCDRWVIDFMNFYNDMGKRPSKKHSIDRINVNGGYNKRNCKWSTNEEQQNNKSNTIYVLYNGKKLPLSIACKLINKSRHTVWKRLNRGESFEYIINNIKPRSPLVIEVNGIKKPITQWAKIIGVTRTSAYRLHRNGRLVEKIISTQ